MIRALQIPWHVAVRAHVPILVGRGVLDLAGILPEEDLQASQDEEGGLENETADSPDARKRLSVFEDFLQNVKLDDSGGQSRLSGRRFSTG